VTGEDIFLLLDMILETGSEAKGDHGGENESGPIVTTARGGSAIRGIALHGLSLVLGGQAKRHQVKRGKSTDFGELGAVDVGSDLVKRSSGW